MLNRLHQFGAVISEFNLPEDKLALPLEEFRSDPEIVALKAGKVVVAGRDNAPVLATDLDAQFAGFLVNDVAGYSFENVPAYASGLAPVMQGGGLVETDQVVEETIQPGDKLWLAAGMLTNVDPATTPATAPFALARSSNSATDKTLLVQF